MKLKDCILLDCFRSCRKGSLTKTFFSYRLVGHVRARIGPKTGSFNKTEDLRFQHGGGEGGSRLSDYQLGKSDNRFIIRRPIKL